MRLLLCCAMSAGLFLSACSATQPVRPDKAGSIAPTQNVVVIRGLEGEGDVQRAPPAVVRRLEVEERNNRYLSRLQAVEPPDLHVRVVDVGQGLCVVGLTAEGYTFLVDAGHWIGNACADGVDKLLPDMGLSMVVLTHSDGDHLGNLPLILESREVGTLLWTGYTPPHCTHVGASGCTTFFNAREAIGEVAADQSSVLNLKTTPLASGQVFELGEVEITFLAGWHEFPDVGQMSPSEISNAVSIMVRISHGGRSILVTGDAIGRPLRGSDDETCTGSEGWAVENVEADLLSADVLIASHHGGNNGSAKCFITAVAPEFVIFSAGGGHGHPHRETVARFLAAGIPEAHLLRTDRGSNSASDAEEGEWAETSVPACGDGSKDDDIDILFGSDGGITTSYVEPNRCE